MFRNPSEHKRSISPDGRMLEVQRRMWFWPSARLGCQCWPIPLTEHHVQLYIVTIHHSSGTRGECCDLDLL